MQESGFLIEKNNIQLMKYIKQFESMHQKVVKFTNKRNPRLEIVVTKTPDGRITDIQNETGIRFPFSVGQILNRSAEVWACNNNFLMDGKDTCPEKKIFGVRTSDVPQGHGDTFIQISSN